MKMKLTYAELVELDQAITRAMDLRGRTVAYALTRNQRKISAEIKDMEKAAPTPSDEQKERMRKFQDGQFEIAKKYATGATGADGRGINVTRDIPTEKRAEYLKEVEAFRDKKENKAFLAEMDQLDKARAEYFGDPKLVAEIETYTIKIQDFPEDVSASVLAGLGPLIEEEG